MQSLSLSTYIYIYICIVYIELVILSVVVWGIIRNMTISVHMVNPLTNNLDFRGFHSIISLVLRLTPVFRTNILHLYGFDATFFELPSRSLGVLLRATTFPGKGCTTCEKSPASKRGQDKHFFAEVPRYTIIMTYLWHNYGIIMGVYGTSIKKKRLS